MTNKTYAEKNIEFQKACAVIGLAPSARQASKYRRQKGDAYMRGRPLLRGRKGSK